MNISVSGWNFLYSLLGIETQTRFDVGAGIWGLKFPLLPIRDWNRISIASVMDFKKVEISFTPY